MKGSVLAPFEIMLVIAILVIGIVLVIIYLPFKTLTQSCQALQKSDLQDVWNKVEEVRKVPGYQITFLTIRDCVEYIRYENGKLLIKYKEKEGEEGFPRDKNWPVEWSFSQEIEDNKMLSRKTYALRIYADRIEVSEVE